MSRQPSYELHHSHRPVSPRVPQLNTMVQHSHQASDNTITVKEGDPTLQSATTMGAHDMESPHPPPPSGPPGPPGAPGGPVLLSQMMSKPREIAFISIISMVQVIPQAVLATLFPSNIVICAHFGITDPGLVPWTVAACALTWGTFILPAGRLGDIFGHKKLVIIGFIWLAIWSFVAGMAVYANFVLFLFARALQGIGSAILVPNGLALLGRTYAPMSKQKSKAFALFGFMAPCGALLGMTFGAIFAELAWWPWMFFVTTIVCFILAGLAHIILISPPPSPQMMKPFTAKLRDFDYAGAFTGVTGLVCINIAWNCAPAEGWGTQYIYMLLIIGFIFMAGFVLIEVKVAEQPLVPFHTLKNDVAYVLASVACGWGCFGVWVYYFWQFLLHIRDSSPLLACAQFFPIVPLGLVATFMTGHLMHTTRPAWILTWAMSAFSLGMLLLALAPADQTYWGLTFVSLLVMPFGMDMSFPAATVIMSNAVPKDKQGMAGSMVATVVNYSISLGLGFAATVEVSVNNGGRTTIDKLCGYRGAWYMGLGLGFLGTLIALSFLLRGFWTAWKEKQFQKYQQKNMHDLSPELCAHCGFEKRSVHSATYTNQQRSSSRTSYEMRPQTSSGNESQMTLTMPPSPMKTARTSDQFTLRASDTFTVPRKPLSMSSLTDQPRIVNHVVPYPRGEAEEMSFLPPSPPFMRSEMNSRPNTSYD